jgi:hypothetical protein
MAWSMVLACVLAGLQAWPVEAALRYCTTAVTGTGTAESELEARKEAMDDWKAKSITAGIEHPAWRIALAKSIGCESAADGGYVCNAVAAPCTISQVPIEQ